MEKKVTIKPKVTIHNLLKRFKLNEKKVAIEHNGVIVQRSNYKKKYLKNNDKVRSSSFYRRRLI